eukprot:Sdes_comp20412_c0_seq1m14448
MSNFQCSAIQTIPIKEWPPSRIDQYKREFTLLSWKFLRRGFFSKNQPINRFMKSDNDGGSIQLAIKAKEKKESPSQDGESVIFSHQFIEFFLGTIFKSMSHSSLPVRSLNQGASSNLTKERICNMNEKNTIFFVSLPCHQ